MGMRRLFVPVFGWATFVAVLVACGGDAAAPDPTATRVPVTPRVTEGGPTSAPTWTPTPAPTPTITPMEGVEVRDLVDGLDVEFPENTAIIIETGCSACDSHATGLVRLYRNRGVVFVDELFQVDSAPDFLPYFASHAISGDGSELAISVCEEGNCGDPGFPEENSVGRFHHSLDGGVSWNDIGTSHETPFAVAIQGGRLERGYWERVGDFLDMRVESVEKPAGAGRLPYVSPETGELYWVVGGRLLRADGSVAVEVKQAALIHGLLQAGRATKAWVLWSASEDQAEYLLTQRGLDGTERGYRVREYLPGAAALDSQRVLATMSAGSNLPAPAVIDLGTGTVHRIKDFLTIYNGGRNVVLKVFRGPFLRVASGEDCLNVRAEAGTQAEVVECLADGVLAYDVGPVVAVGGEEWRQVRLLDGRTGWAPGQFLSAE